MFKKRIPVAAASAAARASPRGSSAQKASPAAPKLNTKSVSPPPSLPKRSLPVTLNVTGSSNGTPSTTDVTQATAPTRDGEAEAGVRISGKAKTLALIEKHRRILEEAQRQKEEMESITEEQQEWQQWSAQHGDDTTPTTIPTSTATASTSTTTNTSSPPSNSPPPPLSGKSEKLPVKTGESSIGAKPTPPAPVEPDAFTALIDQFLAATEPLADLDETIQTDDAPPMISPAPAPTKSPRSPVLTHRSFSASLACPKKFYLLQNRPDLIPRSSLGEMMHFDDSVGFNELARRWDRLQFGSRAAVVNETDFQRAVQHTEQLIVSYFSGPYASLGEQAPSLTIHRPAFAVEYPGAGVPHDGDAGTSGKPAATAAGSASVELRARPAVIRYRPKENQWVFIDAQAVVDPVSTPARITNSLQRFHFTILCFRYWLAQPHLPIELRKKFFQVNLDGITAESLRGHSLESTARPAAPVDLKRSGLLHIRQYFPGPVTLVDCAPPQLVKFIQRLSLEELLEEDSKHYAKEGGRRYGFYHGAGGGGGAFDLSNYHSSVSQHGQLRGLVSGLQTQAQELTKLAASRTGRSVRQRELVTHRVFEAGQSTMEAMLQRHTLPLIEQQQQAMMMSAGTERSSSGGSRNGGGKEGNSSPVLASLTAFSDLLGDAGFVHASASSVAAAPAADGALKDKKKSVKAAALKLKAAHGKGKAVAAEADSDAITGCGSGDVPSYGQHIGPQCLRGGDSCPFFSEGFCLPRRVENPVLVKDNHLFTMPSTSLSRKSQWWAEGQRTVQDVLHTYYRVGGVKMRLTQAQLRYAEALTQGKVALNPDEIDAFFARIRYPLFVIDFEAAQFALPPFQKQIAYQSIPFQFSLDVFQHDVLTEEPVHYNYLHFGKECSPNTDPRPSCVAELLHIVRQEREKKKAEMTESGELARIEQAKAAELEQSEKKPRRGGGTKKKVVITRNNPLEEPLNPYDGTFIAHFASFEKSCLEKLGQLEEAYKDEIKAFLFLDTLDLIKKGCVHPNTHGSNSLKKVLPALCPDFQYGIFGSETGPEDATRDSSGNCFAAVLPSSSSSTTVAVVPTPTSGGAGEGQDEQKGENAMGVFRLWYHLEGGGTVQDLQRASHNLPSGKSKEENKDTGSVAQVWSDEVRTTMSTAARTKMWDTLRIQLLEYCSLDTKALYEIMREIHSERESISDDVPRDKNGWVFLDPIPREIDL